LRVWRLSKTHLAAVVSVLALLMAAPSAFAHTSPVEMKPADNATIAALGPDGLPYVAGALSRSRAKY